MDQRGVQHRPAARPVAPPAGTGIAGPRQTQLAAMSAMLNARSPVQRMAATVQPDRERQANQPKPIETGAAATIQRKIIDNDTPPPDFASDGERPKWQAAAERAILADFNIQQGLSVTKVPYVQNQLARCHILAFDDIQSTVLEYLNSSATNKDSALTIWLYNATAGIEGTPAATRIEKAGKALMTGPSARIANTLLGLLNSLANNLRAANAILNSYIGEHPDPHGSTSPGGHWHPDLKSRQAIDLSSNNLLLTPQHQSRIVTSEGPVGLGSLSPRFQSQLQGRPWETRGVHSASTIGALYPGSTETSIKAAQGGTFNFPGITAAPSNLGGLYYEYGILKKKPIRSQAEELQFQQLEAQLKSAGYLS